MKTMSYKGYTGSIAFSNIDNVLYGKIEGIDGLVNYEAENIDELQNAFKMAVNNYLDYLSNPITP